MEKLIDSDPFAWLEDQDSPKTRQFIESEQRAYHAYLASHVGLRTRIESRVTELLKVATVDLPFPDRRGGLIFLKRAPHEEQKSIQHLDPYGNETTLVALKDLDVDNNFSLSIVKISSEGQYLAFGLRAGGDDGLEIGFYDLGAGRILPDRLASGIYRGLVFDRDVAYYSSEQAGGKGRNQRAVRCHRFGTTREDDVEVFCAGEDSAVRLLLCQSEDDGALGYLLMSLEQTVEARFLVHRLPLDSPPEEIVPVSDGIFAPRFWSSHIEALTTRDAPLGRIVRISRALPTACDSRPLSFPTGWQTLIEIPGERINSFQLLGSLRLIHSANENGQKTHIFQPDGLRLRTFEYPGQGTTVVGSVDEGHSRLFFAHSNIEERPAISYLDLTTGECFPWQIQAPKFYVASACERLEYPSSCDVRVPLNIVHPKAPHPSKPVVLTAYGSGASDLTPRFSVLQTVLLEAGFICAIAHVRGGGADPAWCETGRGRLKQNSVDDLISAAEWLIAQGYCTSDHLGIAGQSAGGLLILGALTQRPDLFRAALALGPIADLKKFHQFGVAQWFVEELGDPGDEADHIALWDLSPYHRLCTGTAYPATLLISGDRDKRCDAMHARKMAARLGNAQASPRPILLDYSALRGHKATLPLSERIQSLTNRLTFLIAELTESAGGDR